MSISKAPSTTQGGSEGVLIFITITLPTHTHTTSDWAGGGGEGGLTLIWCRNRLKSQCVVFTVQK